MDWNIIPGYSKIKKQLIQNIKGNRIAHAQLFVGKDGYASLALALAYANEVIKSNKNANQFDVLKHPDVYFSYPIILSKDKGITKSVDVIDHWRAFLQNHPFGLLKDWRGYFPDAGNKKMLIGVEESAEIIKNYSLKSHQAGTKIQLIWLPEKMNVETSNKILKLIEEPPEKSLIILITNSLESLLPTIISRCQQINIPPLEVGIIQSFLEENKGIEKEQSKSFAIQSYGAIGKAISLAEDKENAFENYFIEWIRNAFMAKKNLKALRALEEWSKTMNSLSRDTLIDFIKYAVEIFRLALHCNYKNQSITYRAIESNGFDWDKFSTYIHGGNIETIYTLLNKAAFELNRNANTKSVLLNLSIDVTREIHKKL